MEGGSANAYDYASGDPVNGLDLDGRAACRGKPPWRQTGGGFPFTVCRVLDGAHLRNRHREHDRRQTVLCRHRGDTEGTSWPFPGHRCAAGALLSYTTHTPIDSTPPRCDPLRTTIAT